MPGVGIGDADQLTIIIAGVCLCFTLSSGQLLSLLYICSLPASLVPFSATPLALPSLPLPRPLVILLLIEGVSVHLALPLSFSLSCPATLLISLPLGYLLYIASYPLLVLPQWLFPLTLGLFLRTASGPFMSSF